MKNITILAIIAIIATIGMVGSAIGTGMVTQHAYAAANCDKADLGPNNQGNVRGNSKQCGDFQPEQNGPKEPNRDCDHKNSFKDNDNDGSATCALRGN
jgi:hypothetical protein